MEAVGRQRRKVESPRLRWRRSVDCWKADYEAETHFAALMRPVAVSSETMQAVLDPSAPKSDQFGAFKRAPDDSPAMTPFSASTAS